MPLMDGKEIAPPHSSSPIQLTREDLAAVAATYAAESRKYDKWEMSGVLGGLSLGMLLMFASSRMGLGDRLDPIFFFGGWGIALATMFAGWRRRRTALAGLPVACANCSAPLMEAPRFLLPNRIKAALARADIIVATGTCPSCGHEFVAR